MLSLRRCLFAVALAASVLFAPAARAQVATGQDEWMAVYLMDKKIGWARARSEKTAEGWSTESELLLELKRIGNPMTVRMLETTVEDDDGKVLRFSFLQEAGGQMKSTGEVAADGTVTLDQNGMKRTFPFPGGALGPHKFEQLALAKGREVGTSGEATIFSTQAPDKAITATWKIAAREKKDVLGRVVELLRVETTNSLAPTMPQTMWVDDEGDLLAMETPFPGMGTMAMFRTEEAFAKSASEGAEVFMSTVLEPDRVIPEPRKLERALYRLGKREGTLDGIYEDEGQKVLARADGKLDLEIVEWVPPAEFKSFERPWKGEEAGIAAYLKPTAYCECEDAEVKKLSAEAVGEERNALAAARLIETYVRDKIKDKNFNVGFASAAEVARSLEGDCTEHGVLSAGIARAAGIPARVVMGLVYMGPGDFPGGAKNGIFGYHMWTEAYVGDGRWYPIDAAIGTYDATHIALAKSDLASTNPNLDMVLPMLEVLGQLRIEVVEPR